MNRSFAYTKLLSVALFAMALIVVNTISTGSYIDTLSAAPLTLHRPLAAKGEEFAFSERVGTPQRAGSKEEVLGDSTTNSGNVTDPAAPGVRSFTPKGTPKQTPAETTNNQTQTSNSPALSADGIRALVDQRVEALAAGGQLTALQGPAGPQGPQGVPGQAGVSSTSTAPALVTYVQTAPQNNYQGGSFVGFGSLSSNSLAISNSLTAGTGAFSGQLTSGPLSVSGNAAITGALSAATSSLSTLTVTGPATFTGSTTIAGLTVTGLNPGLLQGSIAFQGASGLTQDNTGLFYDATNHRLGLGTTTPAQTLTVIGNAAISGSATTQSLTVTGNATTSGNSLISGNQLITGAQNVSGLSTLATTTATQFTTTGNVGIGTTTPQTALDVKGNIQSLASTNLNPTLLGSASTGSAPYSLAVQGRYAYVVNYSSNSLQVFDVTQPSSPVLISATTTSLSQPRDIQVVGRYAYIANFGASGIAIFDISNPSSPTLTGTSSLCSSARFVTVSGHYLYAGGTGAVCIYDISNPASPVVLTQVNTGASTWGVYVSGRYLYAAVYGSNALKIIDISNPASAIVVGTLSTGASTNPAYVTVSGRYVYLVNNVSNTLQIVDVSNPASPVSVSTTTVGSTPFAVSVSGRYAYVTSYTSGLLQVFDVSNPASPVNVGSTSIGSAPVPIVVSGRYAYTALEAGTLKIYDVSGMETTSLLAHSLEAGSLQVQKDVVIDNQLQVAGGINVGAGGIFSAGALAISATSTPSYFGGNVGIGTSTPTLGPLTMASGAYVTSGGVWTNASDRNLKENFATLTPATILGQIDQLPITEWNYKSEGAAVKHIGPVAQDFYALFNVGNSSTSISTIDPAGVALLGIQALDQKITALQGSINGNATTSNLSVYNPGNFSGDSVGQAKILAASTAVRVAFKQPYKNQPILTATPIGDNVLTDDFKFTLTDINSTGFTIEMASPALSDTTFDWHSFASPDEQLTVSDGTTQVLTLVVAGPPPPSPIPAPAPATPVSTTTPDNSGTVLGTSTPPSTQASSSTPAAITPSEPAASSTPASGDSGTTTSN